MSFSLTTAQVRAQTKTVTRRLGWTGLRPGVQLQPVVKGIGLKKGERAERIGGPIVTVDVRSEPLQAMTDDPVYGKSECVAEGLPHMEPADFVAMFCHHNRCTPATVVNRIEFAYTED